MNPDVIDTIFHALYEEKARYDGHPHGQAYHEDLQRAIEAFDQFMKKIAE